MADAGSSTSIKHTRPTFSCIRCADRKVRCDRQKPCSACVKHSVDCIYNPSYSHRKSRKRVKDQILVDRLRHYENLLQEQGIHPNNLPSPPAPDFPRRPSQTSSVGPKEVPYHTPSSTDSGPSQSANKTQLVIGQGRSKFVNNTLWSRVVEEFPNPEDALEYSSSDTDEKNTSDDEFSYVLGSQSNFSARLHHPPIERIHEMWQIFVDRFDPLTKIVHVPTLQPAIYKAASNTTAIPRTLEPIMFAVYGAAIMTLGEKECYEKFELPRKALLSKYISSTKAALSQAKFMGTSSLIVLQALVIHLISVRAIYDPRTIWTLTGVAVRIAQGMGLERDGLALGLSPYETEIRRRIWWILRTHDFRTAELCGLSKFRELDTDPERTKWPTNVNDNQIHPGMPSIPDTSDDLTDMAFVAVLYEMTNFASGRIARFRQQGKNSSQWELHQSPSDREEIYEAFKQHQSNIEIKFLRHCDPSQPLQMLILLIARGALNMFHFLSHHPRRWTSFSETPVSEREWVWSLSIKLLEKQDMAQTNPQIAKYAWLSSYHLPWHVIIHVLDTVRADPNKEDADNVWRLIGRTFENNPDMILDTKKPIHAAVGNLCMKAYDAREFSFQQRGKILPPTPDFIIRLRQRREAAKSKRSAKSNPAQSTNSYGESNTPISSVEKISEFTSPGINRGNPNHQAMSANNLHLGQANIGMETDSFWLMNGFDDSQLSNMPEMMSMDPDDILAQEYNMEDASANLVPWEQWDAWLADSNAIRPLTVSLDYRAGFA